MDKQDFLEQVQDVFRDVLDNETIVLSNTTTSADIDEWDSLAHIQLIVAIEKHFKIKFTSKEMLAWENVGEMVDCLFSKLSQQ